ncbi:glycosyltransferase family A protein [candidate division CSSED10-310 bacterium]|uniref:Glycosyltransferase family A protein n=1 Tax=candidate division CSSED10-310 bacterium TaxID=2855610 RepID=A0ABV6Z275_UNCC1
MCQPLVSIIVPVYNGQTYLPETLDSIFTQDYQPFEVIIVDDGSTDSSAEIARTYKHLRYIYQSNQGVPVARNTGIAASHGEFIAFSDQDDLWLPNKLRVQMEYLLQHPDVQYVLCKNRLFLEPEIERPAWLKLELLESPQLDFSPGALLARKTIFQYLGPFNVNFQTASDVDWIFRAKDANIPMSIVAEVLVHKRIHAGNQSYQVNRLHKEYLKLVRASIQKQRQQNHNKAGP